MSTYDYTLACCCRWCRTWANVPHTYDAREEGCPGCKGIVHGGAQ